MSKHFLLSLILFCACLAQVYAQETDSLRLTFVSMTTTSPDQCDHPISSFPDSVCVDSFIFHYTSLVDSQKTKQRVKIQWEKGHYYFIKNGHKVYLLSTDSILYSRGYDEQLDEIKQKLKGTGQRELYYGDPEHVVNASIIVNDEGNEVEKSISFFHREFPEMEKRFFRSSFQLKPLQIDGKPVYTFYYFSFSPQDVP